jgi:hypothetical protein
MNWLNVPTRIDMKMAKAMTDLYSLFEKLQGPIEAKKLIVAIVNSNFSEMQEEGIQMTPEELEKRIIASANDFLEVAKKTNVA